MEIREMLDLKTGDQVVYVGDGDNGSFGGWPNRGTILTRCKEWLDDQQSVYLTWIADNGEKDYHFFTADELEFIKE